MNERQRCLVADANPLSRFAIRSLLDGGYDLELLSSRLEAVELIRDVGGFEIAVIDFGLRPRQPVDELSATEAIRTIRRSDAGLGIIAHGDHAQRHFAQAALQAGATSYVSRQAGPEALSAAIARAAKQETFTDPALPLKGSRGPVTARQRQILELLADGRSTAFAAEALGLSEETVKSHTKNTLGRLGARNRAHAVAIAIREGLIV